MFDAMPFRDTAVNVLEKKTTNHAASFIITAYSTEPDHKKRLISANRLAQLNLSIAEP
jgi:hypothetical protein